jgi:PAS domain S-box-containing protein
MFTRLRQLAPGTMRGRLILGVALLHAVLMGGFALDLIQREQAIRLDHRVDEAHALSQSLAATASGWVMARDVAGLRELADAQRGYPDLAYAMILDATGHVLAHTDGTRLGQQVTDLPPQAAPALLQRSDALVDAVAPVLLAGQHLGWARVGLSPSAATLAKANAILRSGLAYAAAAILAGSLLAAWVAGRLTRRLGLIHQVASAVDAGQLGRRVSLSGSDEAARVAQALDRMLDGLAASRQAQVDSEQQLRLALDAADMRAWRWDIAADQTDWGDDPQRLLGPRPPTGYPDFRKMVVPEDQARFLAAGHAALAGGSNYRVEFRLKRTDAQVRWFVTSGRVVRDAADQPLYMIGVTQDITARKAAEQLLHHSEARANLIINSSPDALLIVDVQGQILRVNSRVESMFGYSPSELVGQGIECLVPRHQRPGHPQERAAFIGNPKARVMGRLTDLFALRKDGTEFPAQINLAAMGAGDNTEIIATVRDETQSRALQADLVRHRDHLEDLVASRTAELTTARNEAEQLAQVKSEFLANMSHEIRTPLNAVLGLAQMGVLNRAGLPADDSLSAFSGIQEAGQHLLGVINDILDFSRIDAGKLAVEKQPFELAEALANAVRLVAGAARHKGLQFEMSAAADLPVWVLGDAQRLQQVLVNLLANAIKFTDSGTVRLGVAPDGQGGLGGHGDDICFRVMDAGIGMTPEQVERLFLPFEQADSSTTRRFGGSGLGLAISHNLVRLMGGQISVESAPEVGSTFTLRLPLPKAEPGARGAGLAHAATSAHAVPGAPAARVPRLQGLRLLAAEDVEVNRVLLEAMLTHEGAQVWFAENGQVAIDRIHEAGAAAFDAVLMDVQMPVMDGYQATRHIVEIAPRLPVIGLTAHALADERDKCLAAGMWAYVSKPVDLHTLVAAILKCTTPSG